MSRQPAPTPVVSPLISINENEVRELSQSAGYVDVVLVDDGAFIDNRSVVIRVRAEGDVTLYWSNNDEALVYISENQGDIIEGCEEVSGLIENCINLAMNWTENYGGSYGGEQTPDTGDIVKYKTYY